MNFNNILFLTGYDYSQCFAALNGYKFKVLVPKDEPSLHSKARQNLLAVLGTKYIEVDYKEVAKYVYTDLPDLLITFGWRRIIPDKVIGAVKMAINIHPAILPEYKGYHPVPYVLMNNEEFHGITAHLINSELDAGDIVHQEKFRITKFSTLNEIQGEVDKIMPGFLNKVFAKITTGDYELTRNDNSKTKIVATKRNPEDSEIPLDVTVGQAYDRIRACDEVRFPAFIKINGKKIFIYIKKSNSDRD